MAPPNQARMLLKLLASNATIQAALQSMGLSSSSPSFDATFRFLHNASARCAAVSDKKTTGYGPAYWLSKRIVTSLWLKFDHMKWSSMASRVGTGCPPNVSFVTFVSGGNEYLPGSVCLRQSFLRAGNTCPIDLVYDDRAPTLNLSARNMALLSRVYGADRLIPLSSLMARHPVSAGHMEYSLPRRFAAHSGRRLFQRGGQHFATHSKLWYWAMPRSRVISLDADMVVLGSLDWLASHAHGMPVAGVDISNRRSNEPILNTGLMVIEPSSSHLLDLTRLAITARNPAANQTVARAGEKNFGDQSIINWNFHGRWQVLPTSLERIVNARMPVGRLAGNLSKVTGAQLGGDQPALVHWVGEPKPWSSKAGMYFDPEARHPPRVRGKLNDGATLWWSMCREHVRKAWRDVGAGDAET